MGNKVYYYSTPFPVYAGDAWSQTFYFGDWDLDENGDVVLDEFGEPVGTPEDLSGLGGWESQWRPTPGSTTAIPLTVDSTDAAAGKIHVSSTQTREMGGNGVFDIQASTPEIRTLARAKTKWDLDVTRTGV